MRYLLLADSEKEIHSSIIGRNRNGYSLSLSILVLSIQSNSPFGIYSRNSTQYVYDKQNLGNKVTASG